MSQAHVDSPLRNRPGSRHATVVAMLACALVGACTVGPDFHSPAAHTATQYQVQVPNKATAHDSGVAGQSQRFVVGKAIAADWYRLFGSSALNHLIRTALASNPTVTASQASLRKAAYQLKAIAGSNWPDANASVGVSRNRANGSQLGLSGPRFSGNIFSLFQGSVSLGYDMDLFGATRRATEAQQARVGYARDRMRGSVLSLIDNVVVTAVHYAALRDHLQTLQKIVAAEQDQADLLGKQEQAGSIAYADVLRARSQLADTQARLPALRHQISVTEHALARLVGADPGRYRAPALSLGDFKLPTTLPVSLSSELVRQRPDILAAEQMMHAANAQIGVAKARLYPDINLTASLGSATNHLADIFKSPARIWDVGGSLLTPLFQGGTLRAELNVAKANWTISYARYKKTVLGAFAQVADVLDAIQRDAQTLHARSKSLQADRDSLQLVRRQYSFGAADYINVLIAEQRYDESVAAHIAAVRQRFVDTASLYHALGGGWWNKPDVHNGSDTTRARSADAKAVDREKTTQVRDNTHD